MNFPLFHENDAWLVWNPDFVRVLRESAKIMGTPILTTPQFPQQSRDLSLPLELTAYEAKWCIENGFCHPVIPKFKTEIQPVTQDKIDEYIKTRQKNSLQKLDDTNDYDMADCGGPVLDDFKYKIFNDLKKRDYWITSGENYGCDFVIYVDQPWMCHAIALVWCDDGCSNYRNMIQYVRVAESVKKKAIIAIPQQSNIRYLEFIREKPVEAIRNDEH